MTNRAPNSSPARRLRQRLAGAFAVAATLLAVPAHAERTLQDVDFVALGSNAVRITLRVDGDAPEPSAFFVQQPPRLSIDLPGTGIGGVDRVRRINIGDTRSVALAEAGGRTRVVVELTDTLPYEIDRIGDRIHITLNASDVPLAEAEPEAVDDRVAAAPPPRRVEPAPQMPPPAPRAGRRSVEDLDFRRGEAGEGRVIVTLGHERTNVRTREESGRIHVQFQDAEAAERLYRRLDVMDFATPVREVTLRPRDGGSELIVEPVSGVEFDHVAYQAERRFTVELRPLTAEERREREEEDPVYSGERVTLSFQDVEVRSLLQIIADVAELNLVVSDGVGGNMTLRLENVPWDQALDIVLRQRGLGMDQQGNVLLVAPNEEIARRSQEARDARRARQEMAPLRTELIQVNFSNARDLATLIREASERRERDSDRRGRSDSGLLTERGQITVDARTNTLIVQEARENIEAIRRLVTSLDVPVRQVLIESRIAIVNDDFQRDIGVQAGFTNIGTVGDVTVGVSGGAAGASQVATGGGLPPLANRLGVRLPIEDAAGQFGVAVLGSDFLVDLELSAMQMEGRGELISTPRVVTADRSEASIRQGLQIPITTRGQADADSRTTEFVDALLELRVTPEITPDDGVFLDLFVTRNEPDFTRTNVDGNPAIATREVATRVLVRTGETLVLGGAFESEQVNNMTKVPILGDLPLLGRLFRRDSDRASQRELLVFVTPKILTEGVRSAAHQQ